jgi:pimeloyl-ACP methyl ester carboxylesterase
VKKSHLLSLLLALLLPHFYLLAQSTGTKVYLIHGQGSDSRIFNKLTLDEAFDTVCLNLPMPEKNESMKSFAQKLIPKIDTTSAFILIGVSLGGMVAAELNDIIHPLKTILISSAKNRSELPHRYKFMRILPLYKIFPAGVIKASSFFMQPLVEPDRKREKALFKSMLKQKDKRFLKHSIPLIILWDKPIQENKNIVHIHGNNDHTLPIKNISEAIIIPHGSHMMVLTQADLISQKINETLQEVKSK